MKTLYVNHRSDLTLVMNCFEGVGFRCYRVRLRCDCHEGDPRRDGIIVINGCTVKATVIRCRSCTKARR